MSSLLGQRAPDFVLTGTDAKTYQRDDLRGKVTVLLFYIGDNTPTCSRQLSAYNKAYLQLKEHGVQFLGISPGREESHHAFTCRLDLHFPLLSDERSIAAEAYGALWPGGLMRRSTFVIDQGGLIQYAHKSGIFGYFRHQAPVDALAVAAELVGISAAL